jgi:hypothetical protein
VRDAVGDELLVAQDRDVLAHDLQQVRFLRASGL